MQIHTRRKRWIVFFYLVTIAVQRTYAAVTLCNAEIRASSGTFTSPNYPKTPPETGINSSTFTGNVGYITCKWVIEVPPGKAIQLKFADFDMGGKMDECRKGEVEVFTGKGKFMQSIDKYCSQNDPDSVLVTNNTGTVIFRRPSTFTGKGFLISFIAIDPGSPFLDDFVTCSATVHSGRKQSFSVICPSGCVGVPGHTVYGKERYRDDSNLCLAAVHAGVISNSFGGRVYARKGGHKVFFHMSIGNSVTTKVGGYSDITVYFPTAKICSKEIEFDPSKLTASSFWNETRTETVWLPEKADFRSPGGWSPSNPLDMQWIQIDLEKIWNITGIVTLGSSLPHKWTTAYHVKYSGNGITFDYYVEEGQDKPKLFSGNVDHFTAVRNNFIRPRIYTRYLRIYPVPVSDPTERYALKLKVLGCELTEPIDSIIPPPPTTPTTTTTTTTTIRSTSTLAPIIPTTPTTPTTIPTTTITTSTKLAKNKSATQANRNRTEVVPVVVKPEPPGQTPVVPLDERSIIIIAIVAALAVTSILLAALVLILVRKRKKKPKVETMVPKMSIAQSNATYHAGIDSPTVRFPPYKKEDKKTSRKGKNGSQKFLFKNDNYTDSYPIVGAQDHVTVQNARGGVTLQPQLSQNGDIVTSAVRGSYTASDLAGPSSALLSPGGRVCSNDDDTDSFSDDDHEYQVIADPVTEFVASSAARTSSKGSTASSQHSKKSDTMLWQQQGSQGALWGNGDANAVFPPLQHMASFGGSHSQRSRSGTFPHQVHVSVGGDGGELPVPPKTAPPQTSFTAPRFSHKKRGGSQSPPHAGFVTSGQRHSSSSGGSSHSPFETLASQRLDLNEAPYYSSVPEYEAQNTNHMVPSNGHLPNSHPHATGAPKSENLREGAWPRKAPSYKTPRTPMFAALPGNGIEADVRHGGSDPGMARYNGSDHKITRSTSRSDSIAKQRNGYDQLYPQKYPSPTEGSKCVVAVTTMNNYDQLDLHTPV